MYTIPENIRLFILLASITIAILGIALFIYTHMQHNIELSHKYLSRGFLFFGFWTLLSYYAITLHFPFDLITLFIAFASFLYGFYFFKKAKRFSKDFKEESTKMFDLGKHMGFVFGILALFFALISAQVAIVSLLSSLIDETLTLQVEWYMMLGGVIFGVMSTFLAVVGWRLINIRKGWKGELFPPLWLWFRLGGLLFLIVGIIKILQRNLQGLWVVLIAIALFIISSVLSRKQIYN